VILRGLNFGTVAQGPRTLGPVSYAPVGLPLHFPAQQCRVTVDHVEIQCVTGPGVGARLLWTVTVDSLGSSYPLTTFRPPIISALGTPTLVHEFYPAPTIASHTHTHPAHNPNPTTQPSPVFPEDCGGPRCLAPSTLRALAPSVGSAAPTIASLRLAPPSPPPHPTCPASPRPLTPRCPASEWHHRL
jgi:hypothetical protein